MAKFTFEIMKTKVWKAADILRGSIDSADYKNYILGMFFLRRLSDVFEEEAERIERETGNHDLAWNDPDEHEFFIPENARWKNLQNLTEKIGEKLNIATQEIEEQNPLMEGVLGSIDFNSNKLGEVKQRDTILATLIQHFSDISLRNSDLERLDMLGDVYMYLIEMFADDAGKKGGEFYTPHQVGQLLARILNPKEGMRVHDPCVGSGGLIVQCAELVKEKGGNPKDLTLTGQEKNYGTWGICKMNMLLHGYLDADIRSGDTIREPRFFNDEKHLMQFDRVVSNPPFSLDNWGHDVASNDPFGRFGYGVPPMSRGDFAFVLHMINVLNERGQLAVVVPHGVLFRGAAEGKIRKGILQDDLVEAVIGLAPNLFYGTTIPAAILVVNRDKPAERKGKVLFIEASGEFKSGKNQNTLSEENLTKIVNAYRQFADMDKFCRVVPMDEIEENEFNLNITRYVDTTPDEEPVDVKAVVQELNELRTRRAEVEEKLDGFLEQLGYSGRKA